MPVARYLAIAAMPLSCGAPVALAATPDELEQLVRQQAEEIRLLRTRLEAVEARQTHDARAEPQSAQLPDPAKPVAVAAPPPFDPAPHIVLPGPADLTIAQAKAANPAGLTTDWGAGAPLLRSADGQFTFKPRGRILIDASTTMGSNFAARNLTTTGARALRMGIEGGVGPHLFYQFEVDYATNGVDLVTAFAGSRNQRRYNSGIQSYTNRGSQPPQPT